MSDQGNGGEAQDFIKDKKGDQVGRESNTDGCGKTDCKAGIEPCLRVFLSGTHITDRVKCSHDPQKGGNGGKYQSEGIDPELDIDSFVKTDQCIFNGMA